MPAGWLAWRVGLRIENSVEVDERPVLIVADPIADDAIFVDSPSDRRLPIAALATVVFVVFALLVVLGRFLPENATPLEPSARPEVSSAEGSQVENGVRVPVAPAIQPTNWLSTWPEPPDDHAPIVVGSPALGSPLIEDAPGHTLLYVNSIDRPTIIDLVGGRRQELTISPERNVDYFLVENGEVVDDDPLNPDLPTAGAGAVTVFVHHTTDAEPREIRDPSPYAGPHLCLDVGGCDDLWWKPQEISIGGQRVEQIRIESSDALRRLFDPSAVDGRGRFVFVSVEGGGEVKVPIPREGTTIWVISELRG